MVFSMKLFWSYDSDCGFSGFNLIYSSCFLCFFFKKKIQFCTLTMSFLLTNFFSTRGPIFITRVVNLIFFYIYSSCFFSYFFQIEFLFSFLSSSIWLIQTQLLNLFKIMLQRVITISWLKLRVDLGWFKISTYHDLILR